MLFSLLLLATDSNDRLVARKLLLVQAWGVKVRERRRPDRV